LTPPKPHYNGNEIVAIGKYHIPEEELIIWSHTSLKAPLNRHGFERMMELMKQIFPDFEF